MNKCKRPNCGHKKEDHHKHSDTGDNDSCCIIYQNKEEGIKSCPCNQFV